MSASWDYKVEIDKPAGDTMCKCSDCGWINRFADLKEIGDCCLTPGNPSPAGRCPAPQCNSLAYIVKREEETATEDEIARARERYALGSDDNIEIDSNAKVSRGDDGCFVQAWVYLRDDESDIIARRRCEMHEWDHHEDIRKKYRRKRFEIIDNELVENISYYLVYVATKPDTMMFHYMSDEPDFACSFDSLAEVGEPFKQWFIDAMMRYEERKKHAKN
jgi:hypothetical protein